MNKFKHLDLLVYPLIFLSLWGVFALSDQYFVGAKFPFFLEDNEHGWFGIGLNWMSMHPVLWQHHPSPSFNQLSGLLVWIVNPDGTNKSIHQFITLVNLLQAVLVLTAGFWFASVSSVIRLSHPQKLLLIVLVFLFPTLVYHTVHWSIYYLIPLFGLPVGLTIFGFLQGQKQLARTCGLGLGFLSANYYPSLTLLGLVILFARLGSSHNNTGYLQSAVRRVKQKRNISIIFLWCCLCAFLVGIYFSGLPILHNVDNFRPINEVSLNSTFLVSTITVGVLFAITGSLLLEKIVETRPDIGQLIFWTLIAFILSNGILLPWYLHGVEVIIQERATGIVENVIRLIKAPREYPWLLVPLFSMASFFLVIIVNRVSKESNLLKSKESLYGLILAILGTGIIAMVATPELRPGTFPGKAERLFSAAVPALVVGWVILFKSLFGFWRYVWQIVLLALALYSFVHFYEAYRIEIRANRAQGQAIDKTIGAFFQDQHDGRVICVGDEFYSSFCTTAYAYNRYRTDASANAQPTRKLFNGRVISLNVRPDETGNWVDSDNLVDELVFDRFAPKLVITSLGRFQQHLIEMFFRRGYNIKPIWKWKHEGQNEKDLRILEDNFYGSFVAWFDISNEDKIDGNKYGADRTIPSHIDYSDQNLHHREFTRKELSGANFSRANLIESDFSGAELQYALFIEAKISGGNFSGANLSHVIFYRADLSGANLSETDLTGVNLWGAVLNNTDLRGIRIAQAKLWGASLKNANLSNTNLRNQDFSGVNLEGANLHSANLEGSNVEGTSLKGSNLGQANLAGLDLSNKDLSGANLEGANLQGTSLKGSNLGQANLAGLDLSNKDLSGVNLEGANLSGSNLQGVNLNGSNLEGANLQGTSLKGSNLGQANLAGLDLSNKDLSGVNLEGANLQRANLSGSNLQGTSLKGSNLGQANLAGLDLSNKDLSGVNLEGANLQGTSLKGSNLGQANLAGLDLSNKDLSGVNLEGANLQRANLSGSNLQGVNLNGSNLEGANLQGTSLKGSNLGQANLAGLDLSNKDLSGVNLEGANLQRANLSGSNLQGVNLVNANLKETNLKDALQ